MDAALELFGEKGYSGASTREIAERAGVAEALLFRHFGSKANLFQEAVLDPFSGFIARWTDQRAEPWGDERVMHEFVAKLYEALREHRRPILALIAAGSFEPALIPDSALGSPPAGRSGRLDLVTAEALESRGLDAEAVDVALAAVSAMVFSIAVLGPWMFSPGSTRPSAERVVDEIVRLAMFGLTQRTAI